ncbi:NACHT domain-containing protein [Actinomadura violacea]|uniref:ATP-binding protein n=1 Tax=Actinomadura violacea TaxID=2819934 RepID=A0ABS3RN77_9ACTN|nr:ATP-binding protein [Actinomadura violacea]MBO2458117.1 ATP-binding protein [Actinomadura violacea]
MTIADLVAAPGSRQAPLRTLAHVEFQLRVLGLLCAAVSEPPSAVPTPGSLDVWSRYVKLQRMSLDCRPCQDAALRVAECVDVEVATGMSLRRMRNQVFHGGPDPEGVDLDVLHRLVATNAEEISSIYEHGHVTLLKPFFITVNGDLAALNDYSEVSATYWPRSGPATDVTDPDILDALERSEPRRGYRPLEDFAVDIERDLRGFAQPGSVQVVVEPPEPILVHWDLVTSTGTIHRVDRFELSNNHARLWQSASVQRPYPEFLADVCNWELLKERLLMDLEEQVRSEGELSHELFPGLKRHLSNVSTRVRVNNGISGDNGDVTITEALDQITAETVIYRSYTNLVTLTGEAGAGKTHSLLQFARQTLSPGGEPTPIAIYLSSSGETANSLETLLEARAGRTKIINRISALALCRAGLAILVIDGFDELIGLRTYDNPLTGLSKILDPLRGQGTVVLAARSSYAEAKLRRHLASHSTLDWPPFVTTMELLPWRSGEMQELMDQLSVIVPEDTTPEIRQLLITPFFCLAFAAWVRSGEQADFLQFVVENYLRRERRKLTDKKGVQLFDGQSLADVLSEVAELAARNAVPEISQEYLEMAACQALERELSPQERRRLGSLCGVSAEWAEDDLSFKFTHLAIAEQFLARQVTRLPIGLAAALLRDVSISTLCAQLIVSNWRTVYSEPPTELITALQRAVVAETPRADLPGAISLGELWAKVYGTADGSRVARQITVERLELGGSGRVRLVDAKIQRLVVRPGVELELVSSRVRHLDLTGSSPDVLLGDSYKNVDELMTQGMLVVGQPAIRRVLGLAVDTDDSLRERDDYFKARVQDFSGPVIVSSRDFAPEENKKLNWIREYGLGAWQDFVRRMLEEGKFTRKKMSTAGRPKVLLIPTEKFFE